ERNPVGGEFWGVWACGEDDERACDRCCGRLVCGRHGDESVDQIASGRRTCSNDHGRSANGSTDCGGVGCCGRCSGCELGECDGCCEAVWACGGLQYREYGA